MKILRHYNYLLLAACYLLLAPAMVLAGQGNWNLVDGGKVVNGQYQLKCGEGSGWQKCGEEEKKHCALISITVNNNNINSSVGRTLTYKGNIYSNGTYFSLGMISEKMAAEIGYKCDYFCMFSPKVPLKVTKTYHPGNLPVDVCYMKEVKNGKGTRQTDHGCGPQHNNRFSSVPSVEGNRFNAGTKTFEIGPPSRISNSNRYQSQNGPYTESSVQYSACAIN